MRKMGTPPRQGPPHDDEGNLIPEETPEQRLERLLQHPPKFRAGDGGAPQRQAAWESAVEKARAAVAGAGGGERDGA